MKECNINKMIAKCEEAVATFKKDKSKFGPRRVRVWEEKLERWQAMKHV